MLNATQGALFPRRLYLLVFACVLMMPWGWAGAAAPSAAAVKMLFAKPPREFSTGPLWTWNDLLTEEQIRDALRDLAGQNVRQVWVHPRPGLMTPYLEADWFRLWKAALDEARRLDMNVWIYDENSYPSGFAGGWVPELLPEARGRGLHFQEVKQAPPWEDNTLAVFRLADGQAETVTASVRAGAALAGDRFLVARLERSQNSGWHGGRCYVDLLYPGVTEKFLEVTMIPYAREIGKHFGHRVPGVFTDEPEIRPAGGWPWTADLPQQFEQRWGYRLLDHLASLNQPVGDWRKVRHNYFSTLNDLFIERWARPYYEYCAQHRLEFTGHYWEHDWPNCIGVPDNMAMAAWQQRPGIDILMNRYSEGTHAQFGNVRSGREIASIANQLGRPRTLVEIYGAGGWDLRFEDMKRIGDWVQVLGVNTLNEHLSYVTIRGARKNDHPQSFSYHTPWWPAYHVLANYFTRLSAALSQGEQINRVLVLEPTTTAWMYQGDGPHLQRLGDAFFKLLMALESAQIEYDLGCEDVIARHGALDGRKFRVGQRAYDTVIVPLYAENLNRRTKELLDQWQQRNPETRPERARRFSTPTRVDGAATGDPQANADFYARPEWLGERHALWLQQLVAELREEQQQAGFAIDRVPGDQGILFHHRRQLADGQLLFLVNTSIEHPSRGTVIATAAGVEAWDLHTGGVQPFPHTARGAAGVTAEFNLPPCGSLLLFLSPKPVKSAPELAGAGTPVPAAGPMRVQRLAPNVLKLDYVDITAGGETRSNQYYYAAAQFAFQKNGLPANPWDSAVQFKDEVIAKTFPVESGFTASYRFTIAGAVPSNLALVVERPDLYTITCNGQPLPTPAVAYAHPPKSSRSGGNPEPASAGGRTVAFKDWWLDKSFGRLPIASAARPGENTIVLTARPFTVWHELEAVFVLGDFALQPTDRGFVVTADTVPEILKRPDQPAHSSNPDGNAWLTAGIGYQQNADGSPVEDRQPSVIFDLGQAKEIHSLRIWNYNESHVRDNTGRGAKGVRVLGSAGERPDAFPLNLGEYTLDRATANSTGQILRLPSERVRFVKIEILSNHNGVTYPARGSVADHGFVGLGEVEFLNPARERIAGVRVASVSSELASHYRLARHLVDGSGLVRARPGWNEQGHPFYADRFSYRQTFQLGKPSGRYVVSLPDWYGSVAEVRVNGKSAGHIMAAPWECDVTRLLKRGANEVEVQVIGTLKNTLGPHHGNPPLGSAWPGVFRTGPENGPPPGAQYHTVGYGLFAPFELNQYP